MAGATDIEKLYFYRRRSLHLAEAGERARLNTLLTDVTWMQEKLAALGGPLPLIEDYRVYARLDPANKTAAALIGRALSLSNGALSRDKGQLVPHLLGRLRPDMAPGVEQVLNEARQALLPPALVPREPTLNAPDAPLSQVLEGHSESIQALCQLPDGRLASASNDHTIRLWDLETGACQALEGHHDWVEVLCIMPDGRLASGARDHTIRLWNLVTGGCEVLDAHEGWVTDICPLPGGLVSASCDQTVRLWDLTSMDSTCNRYPRSRGSRALPVN